MTGSPCNRVCVLDPTTGFCIGCGRSGAEIGAWIEMTESERSALVARLPGRLARMAPPGRGGETQDARGLPR